LFNPLPLYLNPITPNILSFTSLPYEKDSILIFLMVVMVPKKINDTIYSFSSKLLAKLFTIYIILFIK